MKTLKEMIESAESTLIFWQRRLEKEDSYYNRDKVKTAKRRLRNLKNKTNQ